MDAEQEAEAQQQTEMGAGQDAEEQREAEEQQREAEEQQREAEEQQREAEEQQREAEEQQREEDEQYKAEMEAELHKKQEQYADLDRMYNRIKKDIEMSRTPGEQAYWEKRAETIWQERDKVGGEIEDYKRQ